MTCKEAIEFIGEHFGVTSMYALAKSLSGGDLNVQPTQISNYMKGTRPHPNVVRRFMEVYGIVISDGYEPGTFVKRKR